MLTVYCWVCVFLYLYSKSIILSIIPLCQAQTPASVPALFQSENTACFKAVGLGKNGRHPSVLSCSPGHCCVAADVASSPVRYGAGFWYLLSLALALGCVPAVPSQHTSICPSCLCSSSTALPGGGQVGPEHSSTLWRQRPMEDWTEALTRRAVSNQAVRQMELGAWYIWKLQLGPIPCQINKWILLNHLRYASNVAGLLLISPTVNVWSLELDLLFGK